LLASSAGLAVPTDRIEKSTKQEIVTDGQISESDFTDLPTAGADGRMTLTLNGDFGDAGETSSLAFGDVDGSVIAADETATDWIGSNTVNGLALNSYNVDETVAPSGEFGREFEFQFGLTTSLLNELVADGEVGIGLDNDELVDGDSWADDFVATELTYDDATSIPAPTPFLLLAIGFLGLSASRRN